MASTEGGMDIEEVAAEDAGERSCTFSVDPATPSAFMPYHGRKHRFRAGLGGRGRSSNASS